MCTLFSVVFSIAEQTYEICLFFTYKYKKREKYLNCELHLLSKKKRKSTKLIHWLILTIITIPSPDLWSYFIFKKGNNLCHCFLIRKHKKMYCKIRVKLYKKVLCINIIKCGKLSRLNAHENLKLSLTKLSWNLGGPMVSFLFSWMKLCRKKIEQERACCALYWKFETYISRNEIA